MTGRLPTSALCRLVGLMIGVGLSQGQAASPSGETFEEAMAAAPPWVRDLQCQDIASPYGENLADQRFYQWFAGTMSALGPIGVNADQMYAQLLAACGEDQRWSVVDVIRQERDLLEGLTPQHAGGK
jgi:hypothetical protein